MNENQKSTNESQRAEEPLANAACYPDEVELYMKALTKWGAGSQKGMAMTEAGELIAELGRDAIQGRDNHDKVVDELADMEIMLGQMKLIYGESSVAKRKNEKLLRLAGILDGSIKHPHG